ncbi:MAG: hypothetical protein CMC96_04820 [Flavobacteriales bacterium]|nr:hypothetical protein [Flavobacteriales bacterium]|tara:strand:- start:6585 stop:8645 length:2061 start_codon:yes stop_codon:yes gene_type:complete
MNRLLTIKQQNILAFGLIVIYGVFFHFESIFEYPMHIHARAQSDRLALALNFLTNNFNILNAETYLLNTEFPYNFKLAKDNSIVSVDLPIHDFVVALIMKITSFKEPIVFRVYTLLYSFLGLYFFYKLSRLFKVSFLLSLLLLSFIALSPVFVYYQDGFLPTIPALSNMFIGMYFYWKYKLNDSKTLWLAVLFLFLAAINRTTFLIPFLSVFGLEGILWIAAKFKRESLVKLTYFLPAITLLLAQYLRNRLFMIHEYGSVFLYYTVPAESFSEAKDIFTKTIDQWLYHFMSHSHYILFLVSIIIVVGLLLFSKVAFNKKEKLLLTQVGLLIGAYIVFSIAMLRKFPDHDYYFLDTYIAPVLLILILAFSVLSSWLKRLKGKLLVEVVLLIVFLIPAFIHANKVFEERRTNKSWENSVETVADFNGVSQLLDSLRVGEDKKLLVVGNEIPNLVLALAQRKGFVVMHKSKEQLKEVLNWPVDNVLLHNQTYFNSYYDLYPEFVYYLDRVYGNETLTIARVSEKMKVKQISELIDLGVNELKRFDLNFDEEREWKNWQNINRIDSVFYSEPYSAIVHNTQEFGPTLKTTDFGFFKNQEVKVKVSAQLKMWEIKNELYFVVQLVTNGEVISYQTVDVTTLFEETGKWSKVTCGFDLPMIKSENVEFGFYIWNKGKAEVFYDDLSLKFFEK